MSSEDFLSDGLFLGGFVRPWEWVNSLELQQILSSECYLIEEAENIVFKIFQAFT
jgi:hypothetical protein